MKVRFTDRSLRLRITPGDLAALEAGRDVRTTLPVPGGDWTTVLRVAGDAADLRTVDGALVLSLAAGDLALLVEPLREGVYFGAPDGVRFYVEKDFPCVHPPAGEAQETPTETFAPTGGARSTAEAGA